MIVNWTKSAENDLKRIYKFYKKNASEEIAIKITNNILTTTNNLKLGLYLGQEEELLKKFKQGHRYLISDHVKIIYLLSTENVLITHVFDTRKPRKLR